LSLIDWSESPVRGAHANRRMTLAVSAVRPGDAASLFPGHGGSPIAWEVVS